MLNFVWETLMNTTEKTAADLKDFWQEQFETSSFDGGFLTYRSNTDLSKTKETSAESNGDNWLKIIKGLFLFLPGAFLLFMSSTFLFEAFFSMNLDFVQVLSAMPWMLLWGFMVLFGIGDVKNPKHLAIPFSIVAISLAVFLISYLLGDSSKSWFLSYYSIYLFPLVLIAPLLVKNMISETEKPN